MKKKIALLLVLVLLMTTMTGCWAGWEAKKEANGSIWGQTRADYVVVDVSGGVVMNVWKMESAFVTSPENSDGWVFTDDRDIPVKVGGDVAIFRDPPKNIWNSYVEYHRLEEIQEYPSYEEKAKAVLGK